MAVAESHRCRLDWLLILHSTTSTVSSPWTTELLGCLISTATHMYAVSSKSSKIKEDWLDVIHPSCRKRLQS